MGIVNTGSQKIMWRYETPLVGSSLAQGLTDLVPVGVYRGLVGTFLDTLTVRFTGGTVLVQDRDFSTSGAVVRIEFTDSSFDVPISSASPYIVVRFQWVDSTLNYADVVALDYASVLSTDVVLGKGIFSGSTLQSFDNGIKTKTPSSWANIDNGGFSISPHPTSNYTLQIGGFTYLSTDVVLTTGGAPRTLAFAGNSSVSLGVASTSGTDRVFDVLFDVSSATPASAYSVVASGSPLPSGYHIILAEVTLLANQSKVFGKDIVAHDFRRDYSHLTNPKAHGITRSTRIISSGTFQDTSTLLADFYANQQGLGAAAGAEYYVTSAVSGMPYASATWLVVVYARGVNTSGNGNLVCVAYDTAVVASDTHAPGPYVLRHTAGSGWDASGWLPVQSGAVPYWSSTRTYAQGDVIVQVVSSVGTLFVALQSSTGQDPASDTTNTYWGLAGGGGSPKFTVGSSAVTSYKFVYVTSGGQIQLADWGGQDTTQAIGVALYGLAGSNVPGGTVGVSVQLSNLLKGFSTGLVPGPVFLSSAGGVTQDPSTIPIGNYRLIVGYAVNSTDIVIRIGEPVQIIQQASAKIGLGRSFQWFASLASLPANAFPMDGRAISRTYFSDYFALIGTTFGVGDGASTFNIPAATDINIKDDLGNTIGYWVVQVFPDAVIVASNTSLASSGSYIPNADFENALSGWNLYNDGAVAAPVDGTGGTASLLTLSRNTTVPMFGSADMLITRSGSGSSAQGQGVSYDITVDPGILGQVMQLSFYYKTSAGYADGNVGVFLLDVTNSSLIPLSVSSLPASASPSYFFSTFYPSTSTKYRLILHVVATATATWTMNVDKFDLSKQNTVNAAAVGGWTAYTPTIVGFGTVTIAYFFYKRVGDSISLNGRFTTGTLDVATVGSISLPSGLTVAYSGGGALIRGSWRRGNATASTGKRGTFGAVPAESVLTFRNDADTPAFTPISTPATTNLFANAEPVAVEIEGLPISQWTTNINLATDLTEYAYYSGSAAANASDTASTGITAYGTDGVAFQSFSTSGMTPITRRIQWQRPIQVTDNISLEYYVNGSWINSSNRGGFQQNDAGTTGYGATIVQVDSTHTDIKFYSAATKDAGGTWAAVVSASWKWRVRKVSNGNMAEQPPVVRAEYTGSATVVPTATPAVVNAATKVEDTHSAVSNPSTSWTFTAPLAGVYTVELETGASVATSTNAVHVARLYKNGSNLRQVARMGVPANLAGCELVGSTTVRLVAGDTVQILLTSSGNTSGNYNSTRITVTRIGS